MATVKICDRCGATINPCASMTTVKIVNAKTDHFYYELCVSCAYHLKRFLTEEKIYNNERTD